MNEIQIESNVKMPKAKGVTNEQRRQQQLFRRFANAYERLNVLRPDSFEMKTMNGQMDSTTTFMVIKAGTQVIQSASCRRIKQLTKMMRERADVRDGVA